MVLASEFDSVDKGLFNSVIESFLPASVLIPFDEGDEVLVREGESVHEGQPVVRGKEYVSHASLPGTVSKVMGVSEKDSSRKALKIDFQGSFRFTGKKPLDGAWKNLDPMTLCRILSENGVVNTFDSIHDLGKQIKKVSSEGGSILFVRMFDEDPSRICDSFIAGKKTAEILEGAAITAKALGAKGVVFAFDEKAEKPFEDKCDFFDSSVETVCLASDASKYPDGFDHDLVRELKQKVSRPPFDRAGKKDLFVDVQAVLAAYEAVVHNRPVITRYVHVTGECLNAAAIMSVRCGTTYRELAGQCGGFKRKLDKIVINGIVTGFSETELDLPVGKNVKSIEFLPPSRISRRYTEPCIRCGNCRYACPVGIYPDLLYKAWLFRENDWINDDRLNSTAILCTGCQLCNSVCPSRLPVSQTIALLKNMTSGESR